MGAAEACATGIAGSNQMVLLGSQGSAPTSYRFRSRGEGGEGTFLCLQWREIPLWSTPPVCPHSEQENQNPAPSVMEEREKYIKALNILITLTNRAWLEP